MTKPLVCGDRVMVYPPHPSESKFKATVISYNHPSVVVREDGSPECYKKPLCRRQCVRLRKKTKSRSKLFGILLALVLTAAAAYVVISSS